MNSADRMQEMTYTQQGLDDPPLNIPPQMLQGKILVVDDNHVNREVVARRLVNEGYLVVSASGGAAALAELRRQDFSLVLLDLLMPDIGGIEVLQELRKTHNGLTLPVMIVSGDTDTPQMVAALDLGANDYLTKPIDFQLLLAKMRRHLALSATVSSPPHPTSLAGCQLQPGDSLGHYQLREVIGQGGMGKVYRAYDTRLLREVAIKVMTEGGLADMALDRFLQEAQAVARISHPGVVTIYDVGTQPLPYIAMELLQGQVLSSIPLSEMPTARAIHLVRQVLRALQSVHAAGVIHRDLKPANIMICPDDRVIVMDFGLAKLAGADVCLSLSGAVYGTPISMAPEQLHAEYGLVDSQTDIFAVSGLLYGLVCGQPPFSGTTLPHLITAILYHEVTPPQDLNPTLSNELSQALLTGLRKEKKLRYKNCHEFLYALESLER